MLYKVTDDDGSVIWILGSIHVGIKEMMPLPEYITDAYAEAQALAVECDIKAIEKDLSAQMDMLEGMVLTDGTEISDHISDEAYEKAVEILKDNKSYTALLDCYKPILWYSFIENFLYEDCGYSSDYGADINLLELAYEDNKKILEIESAQFQYDMLADFSLELQIILLEELVNEYESEEVRDALDELVEAWCKGDAEGIIALDESDTEELTAEELALFEEYDYAMVTSRNISMAEFAQNALENDEEIFICVGAAHVVGEGAMIELLAEKGYTVEIIQG